MENTSTSQTSVNKLLHLPPTCNRDINNSPAWAMWQTCPSVCPFFQWQQCVLIFLFTAEWKHASHSSHQQVQDQACEAGQPWVLCLYFYHMVALWLQRPPPITLHQSDVGSVLMLSVVVPGAVILVIKVVTVEISSTQWCCSIVHGFLFTQNKQKVPQKTHKSWHKQGRNPDCCCFRNTLEPDYTLVRLKSRFST